MIDGRVVEVDVILLKVHVERVSEGVSAVESSSACSSTSSRDVSVEISSNVQSDRLTTLVDRPLIGECVYENPDIETFVIIKEAEVRRKMGVLIDLSVASVGTVKEV